MGVLVTAAAVVGGGQKGDEGVEGAVMVAAAVQTPLVVAAGDEDEEGEGEGVLRPYPPLHPWWAPPPLAATACWPPGCERRG